MIVGNWMHPNPATVTGDTLVSEAKRLISENNLQALPVVDERGRLRGLVTKSNLLRQVHFVLRTQNQDEFAYFVTRLKVRDIMVRNPDTVRIDEVTVADDCKTATVRISLSDKGQWKSLNPSKWVRADGQWYITF